MIRPVPRRGVAGPRGLAIAITTALMLGARVGLQGLPVPAFASNKEAIRELDPLVFERYSAPFEPEQPRAPNEPEPEDEDVEVSTLDREVGVAMEQLTRRFGADPVVSSARARDGEAADLVPGIVEEAGAAAFDALFGGGEPTVVRPARDTPARSRIGRGGVELGVVDRSAPGAARLEDRPERAEGPSISVEAEEQRSRGADVDEVVIGQYDVETLGDSEVEALAAWLRANPSPLPVGVRMHLNYQDAFLTSYKRLSSAGREMELFLMFNESLRELHIVLVEGEGSVYLIDRGFQDQSRSLREGTVRRASGEIVAVDSQTGAASSARAQEFYNIFKSWWEVVREDERVR